MRRAYVMLLCFQLAWSGPVNAQVMEDEELVRTYGDKSFVMIATGTRVPRDQAPAMASVITAEDIKAIGATNIDQALATVLGLYVSSMWAGAGGGYLFRGIFSDFNPQVLLMLNGVSISTPYLSNRGYVWDGLPVENVARIEVIRGPGSALYGADAFSGVINVITKSAAEIRGTQYGVRGGSFHSKDAWLLHGGNLGAFQVAAYWRAGSTAGANRVLDADAQTGLDALMGTHASLAPGPMNQGSKSLDGSLDLSYGKWQIRLAYQERAIVGMGSGIASALDPIGRSLSQRLSTDLSYRDANFADNLDFSLQASYLDYKMESHLRLFPPGANLGGGVFVDGMIGNPGIRERRSSLDALTTFTGLARHRVRIGIGVTESDLYEVSETKNWKPGLLPYTPFGTGSVADVTDVSNTAPFIAPHRRMLHYVLAQDEWRVAPNWTLTSGLRRDHYSDFGASTNPRVALAWEVRYNLTARLLHGSAFRAPSFVELYAINNPVTVGNAALKPEKMRTTEAALTWRLASELHLGASVFRYQTSNVIQMVGSTSKNMGRQTGRGLELEAWWPVKRELDLTANFSRQRSIEAATDSDAGIAPQNKAYLRADWRFMPHRALHGQLKLVGERKRVTGDPRANLRGYSSVDLTLRTQRRAKGWEFAGSVRNLFNSEQRDPSPFGAPYIAIPNDLPLPGRSFYLQASYSL